jgi:hypothetical protein
MTHAYMAGYRRIIVSLPAGTVYFQQYISSSQYWAMPAWKRDRLLCILSAWRISKPEMQIEIYREHLQRR